MEKIKIYGIVYNNKIIYVGKTKNELSKRFTQHKNDKSNEDKVKFLKTKDCKIVLLQEVELEYGKDFEQQYLDKYKNSLLFNRVRAKEKSYFEALHDAKQIIKNMFKKKI